LRSDAMTFRHTIRVDSLFWRESLVGLYFIFNTTLARADTIARVPRDQLVLSPPTLRETRA
jgi:hypothetical protein